MKNNHTPGPWIYGFWTIHDEDREAQKRREPYWTLEESPYVDSGICRGPAGRKALDPEYVIQATGYETDGIGISEADARLVTAAPEMLSLLKEVESYFAHGSPDDGVDLWRRVSDSIAKIEKSPDENHSEEKE